MNSHVKVRSIYLTRHGESVYNQQKLIGGDSDLSERGYKYSDRLKLFFDRFACCLECFYFVFVFIYDVDMVYVYAGYLH